MISEQRQAALLTRTFFGRLFETDLMPPGGSPVELVVWVVAFLAAPSLLGPIMVTKKYVRMMHDPVALNAAMLDDRTLAVLLSTLATGLLTLVIWENVFPDRRDARILGVLPVRPRTFVLARLAALLGLFALLAAAMTVLQSLTFGIVSVVYGGAGGFWQTAAAHFASTAGVEAVVFFGIIAMQCALLNVVGAATAQRLAVVLQVLVVITVLQTPTLLPHARRMSAALMFAPLAGIVTALVAVVLYAASYRRMTRLAIEGAPLRAARWRSLPHAAGGAARLATWSPAARAVCGFTLRTLLRSRQHRMLLAGWVGVALALILASTLPAVAAGWTALARPQPGLLSAPLVLTALMLTGMRMAFAIPVEIRANWTLRVHEPLHAAHAADGAAAALMIGVLPAVCLAWMSGTVLWGPRVGILHAAFSALLGVLLAQVLALGLDKIPFSCTYVPGKARIVKLWPVYLSVFSVYAYGMAALEAQAIRHGTMRNALLVFAALAAAASYVRWRRAREVTRLRFEEEAADTLTLVSF